MARGILFYDADCGFCLVCLWPIVAADREGRLRIAPLDSPLADRLLGDLPRERRMASWHLVTDDGRASGGDAFVPLLALFAPTRRLAPAAARLRPLLRLAYAVVASQRGRLSKLVPAAVKRAAAARVAGAARGGVAP